MSQWGSHGSFVGLFRGHIIDSSEGKVLTSNAPGHTQLDGAKWRGGGGHTDPGELYFRGKKMRLLILSGWPALQINTETNV